jgi:hypothetical protein
MRTAPLSRRFGALAIDMLVGLSVFAGMIAAIVAFTRPSKKHQPDLQRMRRFWTQPWIQGLGLVRIVGFRNVRSPGQRLMGIRPADAHSGGPVSVQSAIVREWSSSTMRMLLTQLVRPLQERGEARSQELQPKLRAIQRQHQDDVETQERALMDVYKEHDINPLRSCLPELLAAVAPYLPALWTRRHQRCERVPECWVVAERAPSELLPPPS